MMVVNLESLAERKKSKEIFELLKKKLPGGVSSPIRGFKGLGITPIIVERAKGDTLWDSDANAYIDFCLGFGPLILGHADECIVEATCNQIRLGSMFGTATSLEGELAELISSHMPSIEKIRFVTSGTEATMTALRLARKCTERTLFVKFDGNYHGHADPFLGKEGVSLPYNDVDSARSYLSTHDVAAVIVEPVAGNMGLIPALRGFLEVLREETEKQQALLIFDEIITGFRLGLQGAQGVVRIKPDLTCLGKIIGGGFPAAALGGRKEIMDELAPVGEVFQAGTHAANPIAMRAGLETLKLLGRPGVYESLEERTLMLTDPIKRAIATKKTPLCLQQIGSCFTIFFGIPGVLNQNDLNALDHEQFRHFYRHLFSHGIYFPPSPYETAFVSLSHTKKNLEKTRDLLLNYIDNFVR